MDKYDAYLHIWKFDGKYYVRFSCSIYNELSDYIFLANQVIEIH